MRVVSILLALVLCACTGAQGVYVQVGDRSFPLEAVKQLMDLMAMDKSVSPHVPEASVVAACANPLMPQIFRSVCLEKGTGVVFSRLAYIVTSSDPCEICANPSCFGCLD